MDRVTAQHVHHSTNKPLESCVYSSERDKPQIYLSPWTAGETVLNLSGDPQSSAAATAPLYPSCPTRKERSSP